MKKISPSLLIIITATFFVAFGNIAFFQAVLTIYPLTSFISTLFILSLAVVFACVNTIILSLLCYRYTLKPVLITLLLLSAACAYFMDSYHVIIDSVMIDNILKTDTAEAFDLLSIKQFLYILFLGVVPAIWVYKIPLSYPSMKKAILSKVLLITIPLFIGVIVIMSLGDFYASFLRENKSLRNYANPSYYIYSAGKYVSNKFGGDIKPFEYIGLDAQVSPLVPDRELFILVIGETARADHFSLNGYDKKTNPRLEQEDIINFDNVWSCGTSTAVSVPCLFAHYEQSDHSTNKAKTTGNLLDVAQHTGANVLWLDNNSSSKGVADRSEYISYKTPDNNPICDSECRDIGMLANLQSYINSHSTGDIFIILHQMGNHGPAYYKRYPAEFEKFTPACQTNQLEQCSSEEINNAYDNAILYTDFFLSETITLLKNNNDNFEAALLYVSDHGESLGENGLYLHGLPYMLAPDSQKHVPMFMWFGENFDADEVNLDLLKQKSSQKYSHDNIFHTVLGLLEIESEIYNPALDILHND
ncbi:phosphoethanolamine--lipid A transferase [Pseudomonadota bacterium]|nr:phosphoethanolamine--lipid A transferase [Pseudomonadota bacterium]